MYLLNLDFSDRTSGRQYQPAEDPPGAQLLKRALRFVHGRSPIGGGASFFARARSTTSRASASVPV